MTYEEQWPPTPPTKKKVPSGGYHNERYEDVEADLDNYIEKEDTPTKSQLEQVANILHNRSNSGFAKSKVLRERDREDLREQFHQRVFKLSFK